LHAHRAAGDGTREEDRVELLEGVIYEMTPTGSWHNGGVDALTMQHASELKGRAIVRVQGSFRMSPSSEPEPVVALPEPEPERVPVTP